MIFDKNRKRIEELKRKDSVLYADRISELEKRGPEWWIRYLDSAGKPRDEKCPPSSQCKTGAERYYLQKKKDVENCEYTPSSYVDIKISKILEYYLETKNSKSSSRTICRELDRRFGSANFKRIINEPLILKKLTESMFLELSSPKYAWNHWIILRASFQNWIDLHNLNGRVSNPCVMIQKLLKLEPGTNVREICPTREEFEKLLLTFKTVGVSQVAIDLQETVWESGLRVGEILKWRCENMHLDLKTDSEGRILEIPYFETLISKQNRRTQVQIPMSPRLWEILKRVVAGRTSGFVFPVRNPPYKHFNVKKKDSSGNITSVSVFEIAGLSHMRPFHDYRKSKKSHLKLQGYTSEYTKYLQGHATDSMDSYYTNFKRLDMQDVYLREYEKILCDQNCDQKQKGESFDSP